MFNPFTLYNKTILITGASSGIGKSTAIECSKLGANVVIVGRNEERLKDTFDKLLGENNKMFVSDLNNNDLMLNLIKMIPALDGIVHSAGIQKTMPFQFINKEKINDVFSINFVVPMILTQQILKRKKLNTNASIVFISSIDGTINTHIGNSIYSASKGAVLSITKSLALELSYKKIRVNAILPAMTETPLINNVNYTQEQLKQEMDLFPLKRFAKPEEIAYAIIYFLSDASSFTTGSSLIIDGGFTLK